MCTKPRPNAAPVDLRGLNSEFHRRLRAEPEEAQLRKKTNLFPCIHYMLFPAITGEGRDYLLLLVLGECRVASALRDAHFYCDKIRPTVYITTNPHESYIMTIKSHE